MRSTDMTPAIGATTRSEPRSPAVRASVSSVEQLTWPRLIALHLVPGALVTAGFIALAPVVQALGLPPIAALLAAIAFVLVPVELGIVIWAGRQRPGRGLFPAVAYRSSVPLRTAIWLVPALIVLAFLGFGLHQAIEPALIERLFGWLPGWFVSPIVMEQVGGYTRTAWLVTLAAYFALNGLLGPIVEELYFRGYLLPRMERLGRWAPLVNVTLFSLYHFWSPWQLVARILGITPVASAVRRTRSVALGMVVHCTLNLIGVSLVASMVLSRV